jgi:multimeric flavodoxin WrbA
MAQGPVIILGSSRRYGETGKMADYLRAILPMPLYDLNDYDISYFDYEHQNRGDDFLPLITTLINEHHTFIFASPVYWYTMSAVMKTFFDRISDLLKMEKPTGRKLRDKNMAVLSCASENELKPGFHMPFIESAHYLGMQYLGHVHCWMEDGMIPDTVKTRLKQFAEVVA